MLLTLQNSSSKCCDDISVPASWQHSETKHLPNLWSSSVAPSLRLLMLFAVTELPPLVEFFCRHVSLESQSPASPYSYFFDWKVKDHIYESLQLHAYPPLVFQFSVVINVPKWRNHNVFKQPVLTIL